MAPESGFRQADQHRRDVNLFAFGGQDGPRLKELQNLPEGFRLIGVGRPSEEVAGKPRHRDVCLHVPLSV